MSFFGGKHTTQNNATNRKTRKKTQGVEGLLFFVYLLNGPVFVVHFVGLVLVSGVFLNSHLYAKIQCIYIYILY